MKVMYGYLQGRKEDRLITYQMNDNNQYLLTF